INEQAIGAASASGKQDFPGAGMTLQTSRSQEPIEWIKVVQENTPRGTSSRLGAEELKSALQMGLELRRRHGHARQLHPAEVVQGFADRVQRQELPLRNENKHLDAWQRQLLLLRLRRRADAQADRRHRPLRYPAHLVHRMVILQVCAD